MTPCDSGVRNRPAAKATPNLADHLGVNDRIQTLCGRGFVMGCQRIDFLPLDTFTDAQSRDFRPSVKGAKDRTRPYRVRDMSKRNGGMSSKSKTRGLSFAPLTQW